MVADGRPEPRPLFILILILSTTLSLLADTVYRYI